MARAKVWHAPVQDYAAVAADAQVAHMGSLMTVAGAGESNAPVTLVNHPVRYDGEAATVRLPPQRLGAQTREVLAELGFGLDLERCAVTGSNDRLVAAFGGDRAG